MLDSVAEVAWPEALKFQGLAERRTVILAWYFHQNLVLLHESLEHPYDAHSERYQYHNHPHNGLKLLHFVHEELRWWAGHVGRQ